MIRQALATTFCFVCFYSVIVAVYVLRKTITIFYQLWPTNQKWVLDWIYFRSTVLQKLFSFRLKSHECVSSSRAVDLALNSGMKCEEHQVVTTDGYILCLHRCYIASKTTGSPLLVMHGLLQDSESLLCGGKQSLAYALANAGYDVWLGNNRGNRYSNTHTRYTTEHYQYWDFCIDDLARYDIPAMLEYVLCASGKPQLGYVGFSQGTAQAFAAFALQPQLCSKVSIFIALAPAIRSPGLANKALCSIINEHNHLLLYALFGRKCMLKFVDVVQNILSPSFFALAVSRAMLFLFNWKCQCISPSRRVQLFRHAYSHSSVKCVSHWFQIIQSGGLGTYNPKAHSAHDHYSFAKVTCPVAAILGAEDRLIDASKLVDEIPNCVYMHEQPLYEHLDLIWADDASSNIFPRVIEQLKVYTSERSGYK